MDLSVTTSTKPNMFDIIVNNDNGMFPLNITHFSDKLMRNEYFTIVKFGDGEILNMNSENEQEVNCDNTRYTKFLKYGLILAYPFYLMNPRTYICKWEEEMGEAGIINLYDLVLDSKNMIQPLNKFVEYNIMIHKLPFKNEMIRFFKIISLTQCNKLYICNKYLAKYIKEIFPSKNGYTTKVLVIPETDCGDYHTNIFLEAIQIIKKDFIVMTSCGVYSKVLIKSLMEVRPDNWYIDVGSSFDGLYTHSRNFNGSHEYKYKLSELYLGYNDD